MRSSAAARAASYLRAAGTAGVCCGTVSSDAALVLAGRRSRGHQQSRRAKAGGRELACRHALHPEMPLHCRQMGPRVRPDRNALLVRVKDQFSPSCMTPLAQALSRQLPGRLRRGSARHRPPGASGRRLRCRRSPGWRNGSRCWIACVARVSRLTCMRRTPLRPVAGTRSRYYALPRSPASTPGIPCSRHPLQLGSRNRDHYVSSGVTMGRGRRPDPAKSRGTPASLTASTSSRQRRPERRPDPLRQRSPRPQAVHLREAVIRT